MKVPRRVKYRELAYKIVEREHDQTDLLMTILAAQQSSGGFLIDDKLARLLRIDLKLIRKHAEQLKTNRLGDAFLILCTIIIFEILQIHFSRELNIWQPVTEKSRKWLADISLNEMTGETSQKITIWANSFVADNVRVDSIN
jgi:hypothetical protein